MELVEAKLHVKNQEWEEQKAEAFIHKAKAEEEKIERQMAQVSRSQVQLSVLSRLFSQWRPTGGATQLGV